MASRFTGSRSTFNKMELIMYSKFVSRRSHSVCSTFVFFCMLGTIVAPHVSMAASILIPVANRVDHVYDPTRNLLYITASDGTLQRWSIASQSLLAPYTGGVNLSGVDITPDGASAYAGEATAGATSG